MIPKRTVIISLAPSRPSTCISSSHRTFLLHPLSFSNHPISPIPIETGPFLRYSTNQHVLPFSSIYHPCRTHSYSLKLFPIYIFMQTPPSRQRFSSVSRHLRTNYSQWSIVCAVSNYPIPTIYMVSRKRRQISPSKYLLCPIVE